MSLKNININEETFDLFVSLDPEDKVQFIYDALTDSVENSYQKQLEILHTKFEKSSYILVRTQDLLVGPYRLCITNYGDIITFNSDSIRVIRHFIKKMAHDGTMLTTLSYIKKSEVDMYKYFKAYKILGTTQPICEN
jgi:hypothetical protein